MEKPDLSLAVNFSVYINLLNTVHNSVTSHRIYRFKSFSIRKKTSTDLETNKGLSRRLLVLEVNKCTELVGK